VLLTAGLAVAAAFAAWFAFRQLRAVDAQLHEARQTRIDSARPFLVVEKVTLLPVDPTLPDRMLELRLKNVGKGVGVDVIVEAWVARIPPGVLPARPLLWDPFVRSAEQQLFEPPQPPSGTTAIMAIAEGADQVTYLMENNTAAITAATSATTALVFAAVTCTDIFKLQTHFPELGSCVAGRSV
jgi:hypothetical protein